MDNLKKNWKRFLLIAISIGFIVVGGIAYNYYTMYRDVNQMSLDNPLEDPSEMLEKELDNPFDKFKTEEEKASDLEEAELLEQEKEAGVDGQGQVETEAEIAEGEKVKEAKAEAEKAKESQTKEKAQTEAEKTKEGDKSKDASKVDSGGKTPGEKPGQDGKPVGSNKKTYEEVVRSYGDRFESLQAEQEASLYGLVDEAKEEYDGAKVAKKSFVKMGISYLNQAKKMENKSDSEFKALKDQMDSELKKASYDRAIVDEVDTYYKQRKRIVKGNLIAKARGL